MIAPAFASYLKTIPNKTLITLWVAYASPDEDKTGMIKNDIQTAISFEAITAEMKNRDIIQA